LKSKVQRCLSIWVGFFLYFPFVWNSLAKLSRMSKLVLVVKVDLNPTRGKCGLYRIDGHLFCWWYIWIKKRLCPKSGLHTRFSSDLQRIIWCLIDVSLSLKEEWVIHFFSSIIDPKESSQMGGCFNPQRMKTIFCVKKHLKLPFLFQREKNLKLCFFGISFHGIFH